MTGMNFFVTTLQGLTSGQWKDLISALLGAVGTGVLFKWSWALEPYDPPGFSSDGTAAHFAAITRRNWWRKHIQPVGLALLFFSFAAQLVGVLLPVMAG